MFFLKKKRSKRSPSLKSNEPLLKTKSLSDTKEFWKQSYKNYENSMKILMFASEEEPWQLSQNYYSSTYAPIDTRGYLIADPDRSNPTRSRTERPLQTIMGFEEAIYKSRFGDQRSNSITTQSSYMYPTTKYDLSSIDTYLLHNSKSYYKDSYESEIDYEYSTPTNTYNSSKKYNNERCSPYQDNYNKFYSSTSNSSCTYSLDNNLENSFHSSTKYSPSPLVDYRTCQLKNRYRSLYDEYNQDQYEDFSTTMDDSLDIKTRRSPRNEIQRFFSTRVNPTFK